MRILDAIYQGDSGIVNSAKFKLEVKDLEAFDISNVAEYLYAQTDQEEWDVYHDFPCLAPPFPNFWMEWTRPSRIVSCENGVNSNRLLPHRAAFWFTVRDMETAMKDMVERIGRGEYQQDLKDIEQALARELTPEIDREVREAKARGLNLNDNTEILKLSPGARMAVSRMRQYRVIQQYSGPDTERVQQEVMRLNREKDARWMLHCATFFQMERNTRVIGPVVEQILTLDSKGAPAPDSYSTGFRRDALPEDCWKVPNIVEGFNTMWFAALLAISFLHCKNVTVARESPPDAKLLKRQRERGQAPRILFKTLEITPMKAQLEKTMATTPGGLKRALHICRGHFANYDAKPLFGKVTGRFWIPQHLRGSLAEGVVHKTYDVRAPK